jgi:uncharacterized membrane protein
MTRLPLVAPALHDNGAGCVVSVVACHPTAETLLVSWLGILLVLTLELRRRMNLVTHHRNQAGGFACSTS